MAGFSRYSEFNSGKIKLSVPALDDEKETFPDGKIEVKLIITSEQGQKLKGVVDAYSTLIEIMNISYPNMKESNDIFVIRHADDLLKAFLLWSGLTQEKLDEMEKFQKQILKDYMSATREERLEFLKAKKDDNDN